MLSQDTVSSLQSSAVRHVYLWAEEGLMCDLSAYIASPKLQRIHIRIFEQEGDFTCDRPLHLDNATSQLTCFEVSSRRFSGNGLSRVNMSAHEVLSILCYHNDQFDLILLHGSTDKGRSE